MSESAEIKPMDKQKGPKNNPQIRREIGEKLLAKLDDIIFWYEDEWSPDCKLRKDRAEDDIRSRIEKWMAKKV